MTPTLRSGDIRGGAVIANRQPVATFRPRQQLSDLKKPSSASAAIPSSWYEMLIDDKQIKKLEDQRRSLSRSYRDLMDEISAVLFKHDPIGINFEENTDEYDPEAGTIVPRLKHGMTLDQVERIVWEEFVRWFESETAGPQNRYRDIAADILLIYSRWSETRT